MKSNSKKIISTVIAFVMILNSLMFLSSITIEASEESVASITFGDMDTFHTVDSVFFYRDSTVMSPKEITSIRDDEEDDYPNAIPLSGASYQYNCHSYAWYSQDTSTNDVWIPDPSAFYEDGSYIEVFTPQAGDIVCYYFGDEIKHSAIVESVGTGTSNGKCGNIDLMTVVSKWGAGGLYRHNGYECPYTEYNTDPQETILICDNVRYYRPAHSSNNQVGYTFTTVGTHRYGCDMCDYVDLDKTHPATCTNINVGSGHRYSCATCNATKVEAHSWIETVGGYSCTKCMALTTYIPVIMERLPAELLELIDELYGDADEFMLRIDADTVLYFSDGQYYMVSSALPDAELGDIRSVVETETQTQ